MNGIMIFIIGGVFLVCIMMYLLASHNERIYLLEKHLIDKDKFAGITVAEMFEQHCIPSELGRLLENVTGANAFKFVTEKLDHKVGSLSPKQKAWLDDIYRDFLRGIG